MPQPSDKTPLLDQIDVEIQAIRVKLGDSTNVGTTLAATIAAGKAAEAVTNAVVDTLTTNIAATQTVMTALNLSTGNGLGVIADVPAAADLHTWIAAAIVTETP